MIKSFEIKLDAEEIVYSPSETLFNVSQNDLNDVQLVFTIVQEGNPVDLTGTTIELAIKKPSGLTIYQDAEIVDATAGIAAIILNNQAYTEYGVCTAEVYIRTADDLAVTSPFYYSVRESIMNDATLQSTNDWNTLQEILFGLDKRPVLTDGVPTFVPEYIGQMAFDTTGKRAFISNAVAADGWQLLAAGDGTGGGIVYWADILNKPTTFAPAAHIHAIADVTGLQAALDSKADAGTQPDMTGYLTTTDADARYQQIGTDTPDDWAAITGKPATFPPTAHTHDFTSGITGKPATYPPSAHTHDFTADITGKPATYPPSAHTHTAANITDFAAAVAADIPAEYLTQTEGDARYALRDATGGTVQPVDWGQITGTLSNQTDLQAALDAKADDSQLTGLLDQATADARYQQIGTDTPDDWADITGKPTTFPPSAHTHTSADITDFGTAVAGAIPAEYITTTEGDAAYQKLGVADDWADITGKPTTFPPAAHTHTTADITDFATGVAGAIPAEYLTATEGDAAYQPKGTYLTSVPPEYLTQTEGDAAYQKLGVADDWANITGKPATFPPSAHTHDFTNDITGKPATYPPSAHTHAIGDVTNLQSTLDAKAPTASPAFTGTPTAPTPATATNTTQIATTAFVQAQGYLKTVPLMSGTAIGGAMVGNGLAMSGNYLLTKTGAGLGINSTTNAVQVQDQAAAPISFWRGTQAAYDAITTKDANTLYFITG